MTIAGLLGRKIGMTTYYHDDGTAEPVTAVEVGPCVVTQVKTEPRDGYEAVQVGFLQARKLNEPDAGHQSRSGGEDITVVGTSKGRGFGGVVRRWNFRGGPKTHGQSDRHRAPGSIGAGSSPGRVWKGTRMAGHYGVDRVTV
ncbi:MAG: 50S ribosomal protein L3, partial [Dehalococcoidia bacterium]